MPLSYIVEIEVEDIFEMKRGLGSLCLFHEIPVDHAQSEAAAMMLAHLLNADPFCFHFSSVFPLSFPVLHSMYCYDPM